MKKNNNKAPKRKHKKYIPKTKLNPAKLSERVDSLKDEIEKNKRIAEMQEHALIEYVRLMTNFAGHDLKNEIHSLDGCVATMDNISKDNQEILAISIKRIRTTIESFLKLSPDNEDNSFLLKDLGKSLELLNRGLLNAQKIVVKYGYDIADETVINHSLHSLIQLVNNLIVNSVKALSTEKNKKLLIEIKKRSTFLFIKVADNGIGIQPEVECKIFEHHFSTTDGSGIGLYHAKYVVEDLKGEIKYLRGEGNFKTVFTIKIPL